METSEILTLFVPPLGFLTVQNKDFISNDFGDDTDDDNDDDDDDKDNNDEDNKKHNDNYNDNVIWYRCR